MGRIVSGFQACARVGVIHALGLSDVDALTILPDCHCQEEPSPVLRSFLTFWDNSSSSRFTLRQFSGVGHFGPLATAQAGCMNRTANWLY